MSRTTHWLIAILLVAATAVPAVAQSRHGNMISTDVARRYDLVPEWFTQVELDPARGRVVNIQYFISAEKFKTVHEVRYDGRKRLFTEYDVDRFGDVLGVEGSLKEAEKYVESLKAQEIEGTLQTIEVPEISLYVTTDRGVVHAIDAETGQTRWARIIGRRDHPTERPGVNEKYVAIVNGTFLYLLKRESGDIIWSRQTYGVPGAGPAISETYVAVPMFDGNVELYDIEETRTLPEIYKSNGRAIIQPIVTPLSIAWPTDRGFLYVAKASKRGLRYRLEAQNTITSQAAYASPSKMLVSSIDGFTYCVNESSGNEYWRFSTGEAISQTPVPVGDDVFAVTDKQTLFCISLETGQEKWWTPGIRQFVACSQQRVYCLTETGRLQIIDRASGGFIESLATELLDVFYPNLQTDRIFLGNRTGMIQCLRETANEWPVVHVALEERNLEEGEVPEGTPVMNGQQPQEPAPKPAAGNNPFGGADPFGGGGPAPAAGGGGDPFGGADPFGGGAPAGGGMPPAGGDPFGGGAPAGGGADPFGGGGDPFGGGGQPPAANPFGGGADPFGG